MPRLSRYRGLPLPLSPCATSECDSTRADTRVPWTAAHAAITFGARRKSLSRHVMDDAPNPARLRFGSFELDRRSGELLKSGSRIRLQEAPLRVLQALVDRPGEIVTREELRRRLWPDDTFV